jgi:hypothetical protein
MGERKLFFHTAMHADLSDFLADSKAHEGTATLPSVGYFDGNELDFLITNGQPGYVSWIDNYDEGWRAEVDGARAPVELSLTTFKAVRLERPGQHRIRFVYRPVLAGCAYPVMILGLAALGLFAWWERRSRDIRRCQGGLLSNRAR